MNYKTHLTGGLLAGSVAFNKVIENLNINSNIISAENAIFMSGTIIGALFPDIDHKGSYIGRRARIMSTIMSKLFKHRGFTHSPIPMTIFTFILFLISRLFTISIFVKLWFIGFYIGVLSHIFLDMITKEGIPLFYPFANKKISLTNIKNGSMGETIIFLLMMGFFIYFNFLQVR